MRLGTLEIDDYLNLQATHNYIFKNREKNKDKEE